jgi:hypothetical protein
MAERQNNSLVGPIVLPSVRRLYVWGDDLVNDWGIMCGKASDLPNMIGAIEIVKPAPSPPKE